MSKEKLLERLNDILGTINDADISIPDNDIGSDLSEVEYYVDSARNELEKLIIEIEKNA
jgi:CBS-domain-containing membrane protein